MYIAVEYNDETYMYKDQYEVCGRETLCCHVAFIAYNIPVINKPPDTSNNVLMTALRLNQWMGHNAPCKSVLSCYTPSLNANTYLLLH